MWIPVPRRLPAPSLRPLSVPAAPVLLLALLLLASGAPLHAQGYNLLVGGGGQDDDCDLADGDWSDLVYGWFVDRSLASGPNGGNGRVLIVDYATHADCDTLSPGSLVGECAYFECLGAVAADHLCVTARGGRGCVKADDQATYDTIVAYDALWFRGGDQSQYTSNWTNTLTEAAIHDVWAAGGVLGGTSAGAMMQSEVVSTGSAPSWEATGSPYESSVAFETGFLDGARAVLPGTLVDTHFTGRARLGRLAVFLGRFFQDESRSLLGIGVDTETGLAVAPDGVGEVMGEGSVTFLRPGPDTQALLQDRTPPYVGELDTDVLTEGFRFDLGTGAVVTVPGSARAADAAPGTLSYGATTIEGSSDADTQKARWYADGVTVENALWFGNLTLHDGTPGVDNGLVTTNLEADTAVRENRAGAPLWGLQQNPSQGIALYTDGFSGDSCNAAEVGPDATLTALSRGCPDEQSLLVVDCCGIEWVDQSTWDGDGNGQPRQSVALTPCRTTLFGSQVGPPSYAPRCGAADGGSCGDGVCDSGESSCSCPDDCGAPPATETSCSDGVDDDCDGLVDGDDPDCAGSCLPKNASCTLDSECCSGNCAGPRGGRSCKG